MKIEWVRKQNLREREKSNKSLYCYVYGYDSE